MCYGCKAPKGQLKEVMGIYETVLNSVKTNPQWQATFNQVCAMTMRQAYGGNGGGQYGYNGQNNYGGQNGNNGGYNNYGDGGYNSNYNGGGSNGNAGSLSDYINQASTQTSNGYNSAYENQQRSEDRVFESYSDYMLGYQNYSDPGSGDVYKTSFRIRQCMDQ
jgi:hypothetical protein